MSLTSGKVAFVSSTTCFCCAITQREAFLHFYFFVIFLESSKATEKSVRHFATCQSLESDEATATATQERLDSLYCTIYRLKTIQTAVEFQGAAQR